MGWIWARIASVILGVLCGGVYAYNGYLEKRVESEKAKVEVLRASVRKVRGELRKVKAALKQAESSGTLKMPVVSRSFVESLGSRLRKRGAEVELKNVDGYSVLSVSVPSEGALKAVLAAWNDLKKGLIEVDYYLEEKSGIKAKFKVFFRTGK